MAFKLFDAEVQNLQMWWLVISLLYESDIVDDFILVRQKVDENIIFC